MVTRHVSWAHVPTPIPSTPPQAILAPREGENSSGGDRSGGSQAPSSAVKSRPISSEDDGSGGKVHSGSNSLSVGDGLDDLDDTPQEAEQHRQRCQAQPRAFARESAKLGGVDHLWWVSNVPSGGGEGDSSLRSSNKGGGSGGRDFGNNAVGSGNESAPTSPSSQDGGEGTGGGREGELALPSLAPSSSTSASDRGAQPILSGRDRRNLEWI